LPVGDDRQDGVVSIFGFALERRHADVIDWEHQIGAAEQAFAGKEGFELVLAIAALDRGRRDDRNKEDSLADGGRELGLPKLARCDRFAILPEPERRARAAKLAAQLALNQVT
jgi:hypothetical protein